LSRLGSAAPHIAACCAIPCWQVFLSATLSNANEFSQWVAYLHKQPCHVVYTDYRPTPLEHYVCPIGGQGLYKVGWLGAAGYAGHAGSWLVARGVVARRSAPGMQVSADAVDVQPLLRLASTLLWPARYASTLATVEPAADNHTVSLCCAKTGAGTVAEQDTLMH